MKAIGKLDAVLNQVKAALSSGANPETLLPSIIEWLALSKAAIVEFYGEEAERLAAVERVAVEEEREACARIADELEFKQAFCYWQSVADEIAAQIRARSSNNG